MKYMLLESKIYGKDEILFASLYIKVVFSQFKFQYNLKSMVNKLFKKTWCIYYVRHLLCLS